MRGKWWIRCILCILGLRLSRGDWDACDNFRDFTVYLEGALQPPCVVRCENEAVEQVCVRAEGSSQISFDVHFPLQGSRHSPEDIRHQLAWSLGIPPSEVKPVQKQQMEFRIRSRRLGHLPVASDVEAVLQHFEGGLKIWAFSFKDNGMARERRLQLQDHLQSPWLLGTTCLVLSCLCCCWLRCKSTGSWSRVWRARHPKAVIEGPPPDTHWRCAEGKLWWKGSTDSVTEIPRMFEAEEPSPRPPPPVFPHSGSREDEFPRKDDPRTSDNDDLEENVERSAKSGGQANSERRAAWSPAPPKRSKAVPPPMRPAHSYHGTSAEGRPMSSPWSRPSTPASLAPRLEVFPPGFDAHDFVQELRHLKRKTSNADRKKLFKELQLRWHPDKNVGDETRASEMFKALQDSKGWFLFEDRPWSAPGVVSEAEGL